MLALGHVLHYPHPLDQLLAPPVAAGHERLGPRDEPLDHQIVAQGAVVVAPTLGAELGLGKGVVAGTADLSRK